MRDEGLFMPLVIHYWIGDVQDSQGVSTSEMTDIVSGWVLNSAHLFRVGHGYNARFWSYCA